MRLPIVSTVIALVVAGFPSPAFSATRHGLDGSELSLFWTLPFAGLLLSIATGPLLFSRLWEHHYGKITAAWAALAVIPLSLAHGPAIALTAVLETVLHEYAPFIIVLFTLFTVAGGLLVQGDLRGTPIVNTVLLAVGTVIASVVGTTGASMILIRPLLRANSGRRYNVHVVVFFIFLVSNIGGGLTPLGDPPLFVGFLRGVNFFWTTEHLLQEVVVASGLLLAAFLALDGVLYQRESISLRDNYRKGSSTVTLKGAVNIVLLTSVIVVILLTANWRPGIAFQVFGVKLALQDLVRDAALLIIAFMSLWLTPDEHREENGFSWEPIREVAILFAGIFVCMIPVLAMLSAGRQGAFAWLLFAVTDSDGTPNDLAYFWLTGLLSSVLDNAPTYLVFFELAGGDPVKLMGPMAKTLAAISMGAVFMGALTYIGNAPNFMVYAIARQAGVRMPSFFGYILWAACVLGPVLLLLSWLYVST